MRRVVGVVRAALAGACLAAAACGSPSAVSVTPGPPASQPPVPIESQPPSQTPPPESRPADAVTLPLDSYAHTVIDDLIVRSRPRLAGASEELDPPLDDGQLLLVLDGPVWTAGQDWYQVQVVAGYDNYEFPNPPFGWVAAADEDGTPWIVEEAVGCPAPPKTFYDIATVEWSIPQYLQITCFRGQELAFRAQLGYPHEYCDSPPAWSWEPAWMGTCHGPEAYLAGSGNDEGFVVIPGWPPEVDLSMAPARTTLSEDWPFVEGIGMFDHPAARTCTNKLVDASAGIPEPDPAETVFDCRRRFVVTSMREVK